MNTETTLRTIEVGSNGQKKAPFYFDRVFDEKANNEMVFFINSPFQ